jgi:ATP-binding cassette, subfamily F, member 3
VITDVIDLDDSQLTPYKGNYDQYVHTRDEIQRSHENLYRKQQKKTENLQQFIGKAKTSTNQQTADSGANKKVILSKMQLVSEPVKKHKWSFEFMNPGSLDHPVVTVEGMSFGWPGSASGTDLLLRNLNLRVEVNSRIGILGQNGAGKSTLLKLILGTLGSLPSEGRVILNPGARIYTFTQHHCDQLDINQTVLDFFMGLYHQANESKVRAFLGHYGFDINLISNRISTLSGGQKSRLCFAIMCWANPHCIIMDEPTNHLDLETIEALIQSLSKYQGGVLTVSHDLYFLENVATEFWAIDNNGTVGQFFNLSEAKRFSYQGATNVPDLKAMKKTNNQNQTLDKKQKKEKEKEREKMKEKEKSKSDSESVGKKKKDKKPKLPTVSLRDEIFKTQGSNAFDVLRRKKRS